MKPLTPLTSVVAASAPTSVPTSSGISTPTTATTMSRWVAAKLRVKMSRPRLSTPNGWARLGAALAGATRGIGAVRAQVGDDQARASRIRMMITTPA